MRYKYRRTCTVEKSIIYPPHIINQNSYYKPYYLWFRYITGLLAGWQHKLNLLEPIDFIFDDDSEKVKIPVGWELMKSTAMPEISCMMGDTPIFRDDKKTMPLQAADLYAWWAFKWQREGIEGWAKNLPFPPAGTAAASRSIRSMWTLQSRVGSE
jgi:hypothetical protein